MVRSPQTNMQRPQADLGTDRLWKMTQPRKPGRPPKIESPQPPPTPPPPGPIHLEIRVNGKIACMQRVHSYKIDQQEDNLTVTGVLRLSESAIE